MYPPPSLVRESFTIADTNELWIMELIGKGPGQRGAVWVAVRIPDGNVVAHANQARITTFPLDDPDNCLYSPDVIKFAVQQGLYPASAPHADFSFSDTYDPVTFGNALPLPPFLSWENNTEHQSKKALFQNLISHTGGARICELRVWDMFRKVAGEADFGPRYFDYVRGYNLTNRMPLSIKPKAKVSVNQTMHLTRTHFEGTYFDGTLG